MSKKNPLTPEEIQAIADAVAERIKPSTTTYPIAPYYAPGFRYWYTVNSHPSSGGTWA